MRLLIKNRVGAELTVECGGALKALAPEQELVIEVTGEAGKVAAELHFEDHNGKRYLTLWPAHGGVKTL